MELQKKFILGLSVVALFGTVTNFIYFSPLLTLLVPLAIFVFNKKALERPIFWLYIFLALFLLSTLLYDWYSLINFDFYRRDGNFLISYSPLFVLPLFHYRFNLNKYIRQFYIFALSLYSILFIYHLLTISNPADLLNWVFGGLFIAQNAVGGFLAVLGSLGFAYAWHKNSKMEWFFFVIIFVILFATYSRGSILGLVLGIIAWYLAIKGYYKTIILYMMVFVLFTIGSLMIGYPYFKQQINTQNYVESYVGSDLRTKNANILIRVLYTFPRSFYVFTQSPIVGTGVGSYDDRPFQFEKIVPYVAYNTQPQKSHTSAHAHHSYLQILAEQGIVGLTVFLTFWISLFWYLVRIRGNPLMRDFLLIAFFTITIAAFTEHRITTPSMMLPFTIPLGMFFFQKNDTETFIIKKIP